MENIGYGMVHSEDFPVGIIDISWPLYTRHVIAGHWLGPFDSTKTGLFCIFAGPPLISFFAIKLMNKLGHKIDPCMTPIWIFLALASNGTICWWLSCKKQY
jgi:hypothetical protein